jgi:DUF971 family protein
MSSDPDVFPTEITMPEPSTLEIAWSDGLRKRYGLAKLQKSCPCATCAEKHGPPAAKPASPFNVMRLTEAAPVQLLGMVPVGNYAYTLQFNHGCSRGIWTFDRLRSLGEEVKN